MARIFHVDLYGTRALKYDFLLKSDLQTVAWQEIDPNLPFYLFRPQEQELRAEYELGWSITNIFPVNTIGIVTGQDAKVFAFANAEALSLAAEAGLPSSCIQPILYRPFDIRSSVYHSSLITRSRAEVMRHVLAGKNLNIVFTRSTSTGKIFDHIFCTRHGMLGRFYPDSACITYFAPMHMYPKEGTFEEAEGRRANLNPAFVAALKEHISETPTPEAIFYYAYAVFHAPTYRERYAPFLKIDFPRLPLPPDADTFVALAALGAQLVALHLLEAPELASHSIAFPISGDHTVKKMRIAARYLPPNADGRLGRVRLNDTEYFDNVPPEAWEFRVGGYQPAFKWLDDRVGRALTQADITHYRRMIAAMRETAALLPAIDAAFCVLLDPASDD